MPQVPEDAHGEAVTPLRRLSKTHLGRFGGPQPSKMKSYRPALPGGRGVCALAQTFLKLLSEKNAAGGLFRHAEERGRIPAPFLDANRSYTSRSEASKQILGEKLSSR